MRTPIVQFGTSRFLQAHVDLFVSDAMGEGQDVGPITVVQTTGSTERAGRLRGFDGSPIPIIFRGLENGRSVERTEYVRSIVRGLSTGADWMEIERIVVEEARVIVSNTGDSGYRMPEGEVIGEGVPASFSGQADETARRPLAGERRTVDALSMRACRRKRQGSSRSLCRHCGAIRNAQRISGVAEG